MIPVLPQEVLELIVDDVRSTNASTYTFLALLRAGRCFGPRCRTYLYRKIKLSLEEPPLPHLTLSKNALRFLALIRSTPSLGKLVKQVTYYLHFQPAEHDPVQMVESSAWQDLIELKQHLVNVNHVSFDFSDPHGLFERETVLTNRFLHAIAIVLPSSSFTTLSIATVALQLQYLLDLLSHCQAVTALTLADIETDSDFIGSSDIVPSSSPSMITELSLADVEWFIETTQYFSVFKNVFSGVQRLVLLDLGSGNLEFWRRIRELIASMAYLDEIFVSTEYDDGTVCLILLLNPDPIVLGLLVPELVHAPSLCIEVAEFSNLFRHLPIMLEATNKCTSRLERLALIIHTYSLEPLPAIDSQWSDLASALCQPHLSALKTVCITFNELHVVDETLNVVRRCFHDSGLGAKVTIRRMPIQGDLHLGCKNMY
ncbi:hypothetical protein BDZ89DRAFT_1070688 [Hymenopellis radicata]|nr:hypothetical protein BDZ89DRAFT_1070688 [Hymenopellis radicata]